MKYWSVEGVEHVEEKYTKEPDSDKDVVCSYCNVLFVLVDLDYETHGVHDEDADEGQPSEDSVVDTVVEEVYAE